MIADSPDILGEFFRLVDGYDYKAAGSLLMQLFPNYLSNIDNAATIIKLLHGGSEISPAQFQRVLPDNAYSRRLYDKGLRYLDAEIRHYQIGGEFDFLQHRIRVSLETILSKVANYSVEIDRDVAVVASCRNEGPWLLEWLAFHRAIGVTDFFLGYNDLTDGSEKLIAELSKSGLIFSFENIASSKCSPQKKFSNFCASLLGMLNRYRWVIFIDIDEFLLPTAQYDHNIVKLLDFLTAKQPNAQAVCFHWKWYSSKSQFAWEPGLVTDRFVFANSEVWVKSAAKVRNLWSAHHVHTPETLKPDAMVNGSGAFVKSEDGRVRPSDYSAAQVNHYFAKSFTEFILKKYRGRGAAGLAGPQRDLSDFLWGQNDGRAVGALPPIVRERLLDELSILRMDPAIIDAANLTEQISRRQAAEIVESMQLRSFFDRLVAGETGYNDA